MRYYKSGSLEAVDVIEQFCLNFHLGNVVKYVLRAGKKGDKSEDLRKAIWYLQREIEREAKGKAKIRRNRGQEDQEDAEDYKEPVEAGGKVA